MSKISMYNGANLQIDISGTTPVMYFQNSNGNVGIGTSTPQAKLDVNGSILLEGTANYNATISDATGALAFNAAGAGAFQTFSTNGNEMVRILSTGVGIGTVSPQAKLEVNGTLMVNQTGNVGLFANGTNVGIGTTSPNSTLTVVGTANITGALQVGNSVCSAGEVLSTTANGTLQCLPVSNGTVTQVGGGLGITATPNPITSTGNISIDQNYFDNLYVRQDQNAGGDLAGNFSNLTISVGQGLTKSNHVIIIDPNLAGVGLNYSSGIMSVSTGQGLAISGDSVIIDNNIVPMKAANENINGNWTFGNDLIVTKNLYVLGNITNTNVNNLSINGSLVPYFHDQFDLGSTAKNWRTGYFSSGVAVNGKSVLTQASNFGGAAPVTVE